MSEKLIFVPIDEPDLPLFEIGPLCVCETPGALNEARFMLEIEEGAAHVICALCKHTIDSIEPELFEMAPIAIRLRYKTTCDGPPRCSNGWLPCDHDGYFVITPDSAAAPSENGASK